MQLNLLVIKTDKLKEQSEFYSALGFSFDYHRHGNGPYHYASASEDPVIEIYPLPKNVSVPDNTTRLGFTVDDLDAVIRKIKLNGWKVITGPNINEWGYTALIEDPDGRKIELKQA